MRHKEKLKNCKRHKSTELHNTRNDKHQFETKSYKSQLTKWDQYKQDRNIVILSG